MIAGQCKANAACQKREDHEVRAIGTREEQDETLKVVQQIAACSFAANEQAALRMTGFGASGYVEAFNRSLAHTANNPKTTRGIPRLE